MNHVPTGSSEGRVEEVKGEQKKAIEEQRRKRRSKDGSKELVGGSYMSLLDDTG